MVKYNDNLMQNKIFKRFIYTIITLASVTLENLWRGISFCREYIQGIIQAHIFDQLNFSKIFLKEKSF